MGLFSVPQLLGYVAFVLGVTAFLQKSDRRLKVLIASESAAYAVHFVLLGNLTAAASALISGLRSFLSLKSRSLLLATVIVVVNLAVGVVFANTRAGWLPIVASSAATFAIFRLEGIRMRVVLLTSTFLWLTNNIISRSIGGTLLESVIAGINLSTIVRMSRFSGERALVSADDNVRAD